MAAITNFQVDVVASGVTGIYGPVSRVTNMSTLPTPNENIGIEFTTALGDTVFMTYEQLTNLNVRNRILGQSGGVNERVQDLKTGVATVYDITNALTAPHTYEELVTVVEAIRENILPRVRALY